jgi:diadenosine tetraphosphatase ApaH/serine/threonine PP2A family protein phosphatase
MRAYKFLTAEGLGVFSRFAWPLPDGGPAAWVESEVEPCRAGIHACRHGDLPYWLTPALYEIELEGRFHEQAIKVVASRGRLIRRIDAWDPGAQEAYGQMCIARAHELVAAAPELVEGWAPTYDMAPETARVGFIAARIAEELRGVDAYLEERRRQSEWLVEQLALD